MAGRRPRRAGSALLEVIVALAILGSAGLALVHAVDTGARTVIHAQRRESELEGANALLTAVALWPRADLDRHLGARRQGEWELVIDRPTATLYTASVEDSAGTHVLLATMLYRPIDASLDSTEAVGLSTQGLGSGSRRAQP